MADLSGTSVASAGDVNGDGFDDLIIGAPGAEPNEYLSGASFVVFGQAGSFDAEIELSSLDGTNGFRLNGEAASDYGGNYTGGSVSSAGDVNGDGFDDLIIGAHRVSANGSYSGASYVVFGQPGGFAAEIELSDLDGINGFRISGEATRDFTYDHSGISVASAGDVNGDGFDDLIIGAYGADANGRYSGASYVVFGQSEGFASDIDLSDLDGMNGFQINGEATADFSGRSVASGDVNGDGFHDLIIGSHLADPNGIESGASYVVFGQPGGFAAEIELANLNGTNGFRINGEHLFDFSGNSVASAGDVNGDGFDDVVLGATGADPDGYDGRTGTSYVVFGHAGDFAAEIELSGLNGTDGFEIRPKTEYDETGRSVASAGDVNGDGFDDVIIGAPGASTCFVVFGQAGSFAADFELSDLDGTNGFQIDGEFYSSGRSVASAGDVNGDGFDDLIIGAPTADVNGDSSGASYVVFGHAGDFAAEIELSSLDGITGFQINGGDQDALRDHFTKAGSWTSAGNGQGHWEIGDFNGDGREDIFRYLPGESGADVHLSNGSAFVHVGSWTPAGNDEGDWNIGDFNGDGKDDIFRYLPGESGADVFLSTGSGFVHAGSWTPAGNGEGDWNIGDFNGDGKDDIFRYLPGESGADVFLSTGTSFVRAGSWTPAGNGEGDWSIGDFNGDGKDDIFRYLPGESGADVFLSTGTSFVRAGSWTPADNGEGDWNIGDFNGDGKDDIFRYLPGESGADVFLSIGSGFVHAGSWTTAGNGEGDWNIGDFNGDGKDDIFRYLPGTSGAEVFL